MNRKMAIWCGIGATIVLGGLIWQTATLEAASITLRPIADGDTTEWVATPFGDHYATLNEEISQPDAADTDNYISTSASGKNGKEENILKFDASAINGEITEITIWVYTKNTKCNGGKIKKEKIIGGGLELEEIEDDANCDQITIAALNKSETIIPSTNGYSWLSATLKPKKSPDGQFIELSITHDAQGSGNANNDELRIAAVYLDVTYSADDNGKHKGEKIKDKEKGKIDDTPKHNADKKSGEEIKELKEKTKPDDPPKHNAINSGGGDNAQ
ncbi:MAG: hypothetical protein ABH822_01370 [Patescibacteria group bacterium]